MILLCRLRASFHSILQWCSTQITIVKVFVNPVVEITEGQLLQLVLVVTSDIELIVLGDCKRAVDGLSLSCH